MATKAMGVTLLDLLFCVALIGALGAVSLPGLRSLVQQHEGEIVIRRLADAIATARHAAITDASLVTLCRSSDGKRCGGEWQDGVLVFTDGNGDRIVNQNDQVRHYFSFPEADGTLRWRAFQNRQYLQFTSQGFTRFQNGNFTYCPATRKSELARQLIVNRTARARFALDKDGDGIREDSQGRPLVCD